MEAAPNLPHRESARSIVTNATPDAMQRNYPSSNAKVAASQRTRFSTRLQGCDLTSWMEKTGISRDDGLFDATASASDALQPQTSSILRNEQTSEVELR